MRRLLVAAAMFGAVQGAEAADLADLPILRGAVTEGLSAGRVNWQGFYIGGQGGYGIANMNFANANNTLINGLQPTVGIAADQYPVLGKSNSPGGAAYGAFTGYNWQFEDVVVGIDASYLHGKYFASNTPRDLFFGDATHNFYSTSMASANVHDFGSVRARAGYMVGNFLPYATAGLGLGSADIYRRISIYDASSTASLPAVSNLADRFVYGYSVGVGMDVLICAGLFMRAEYEYQRITSPVDIGMSTVRGGLGYKF